MYVGSQSVACRLYAVKMLIYAVIALMIELYLKCKLERGELKTTVVLSREQSKDFSDVVEKRSYILV